MLLSFLLLISKLPLIPATLVEAVRSAEPPRKTSFCFCKLSNNWPELTLEAWFFTKSKLEKSKSTGLTFPIFSLRNNLKFSL